MKNIFLPLIATASLVLVSANPTPVSDFTEEPQVSASSADGPYIVIDAAGMSDGVHILRLDLSGQEWRVKTLTAVKLGTGGGSGPITPTEPTPEDPPPKEPDPAELLEQVRQNFGNDEFFQSQVAGMREALRYDADDDMQTTHRHIYEKMDLVVGDNAEKWAPWYGWWIKTALKQRVLADYHAWADRAAESLKDSE